MRRNISNPERVVRAAIGIALLGLYGALPAPWHFVALIGLVPLGTAILGSCPIYSALGWNRTTGS